MKENEKLTIVQLSTFLKIAETGSFSSAAEALGYAQSTVTTQIKLLEEELGVELFDRLGKQVSLTSAGERLLSYAQKMQQLEREILTDIPSMEEPSGVIRLGVSESLCYNRFPRNLLSFTKAYPKVDIQLIFIMHDTFPDMLKTGSLDMVYTLNPLIERDDLKQLHNRKESLGFYVSLAHPLAGRKRISEKDLENQSLLLTSHNCSFRNMLIADLSKEKIIPKIGLETSSKEILKQFAMNEMGIAFMPDMAAEEEVTTGKLVRLNWKGNAFPIYSQVLVHKDKNINKAMQGLVDIISEKDTYDQGQN